MKKTITLLMLMMTIMAGAPNGYAETMETGTMEGTIGKYKIKMKLTIDFDSHKVTGWYYYQSKGSKNKIQLNGKITGDFIDDSKITLTETVGGKTTGTFSGDFWISAVGNMGYSGTWASPQGKRLEFDVDYIWR